MTYTKIVILSGLVFFLIFSFHSHAQNTISENVVGHNHQVNSEILDENRQIQVYLPDEYEDSNKKYPVLYLLDGQRFFLYGVNLVETFNQFNLTPDFILVGINNSYPQRFSHFSSQKENFITFIKNELVPYVEDKFRTTNERMLFGWEYGGSLAFNILLKDSYLFSGYFLASPFPIKERVDTLVKISKLESSLFFSVSPNEFAVNHGVNTLDSILTNHTIEGLDWTFMKLNNEEHRSTAYPTLYHSLRKYFGYYPELQVDDLSLFLEQGGVEYAINYYQKRSELYDFSPELTTWTKFTIIRSAMRAGEFERFSEFIDQLKLMEFIGELASQRIFNIAEFYERNDHFNEAISLFEILLEKHPQSERIINKLVTAHQVLGNQKESKRYKKRLKN